MSIIISAVEFNKIFYIASDKRAIKSGVVSDDYQKIYEIRPGVFYAMTGIAEVGLHFLEQIRKLENAPLADVIAATDGESARQAVERVEDGAFTRSSVTLTIMIAGQNESNEFFIWQKNNMGEKKISDISNDNIAFSIGANKNIQQFASHFETLVRGGVRVEEAIVETIAYASRVDPSISQVYDIFEVVPNI